MESKTYIYIKKYVAENVRNDCIKYNHLNIYLSNVKNLILRPTESKLLTAGGRKVF